MSKETERKRIIEAIKDDDFETACEKLGFTVSTSAVEGKGKKKANI